WASRLPPDLAARPARRAVGAELESNRSAGANGRPVGGGEHEGVEHRHPLRARRILAQSLDVEAQRRLRIDPNLDGPSADVDRTPLIVDLGVHDFSRLLSPLLSRAGILGPRPQARANATRRAGAMSDHAPRMPSRSRTEPDITIHATVATISAS